IKLYRDEQGNPKGDASICYIAEASVDMAVSVLDGGFIRPMSKPLSVSRAEFQKKDGTQGEGEGTGVAWKKPRQNLTHAQVKVTQNAIAQALAWNEDDDLGVSKKRALKIVVLEGMFRPEDSLSDPTFFEDLERDLLQECEKLGEIEKITVFSKNPRGIVIIKFSTSFAAQEC
ncbi:Htatsf1, partial [Symbiodinium microadriaticum]